MKRLYFCKQDRDAFVWKLFQFIYSETEVIPVTLLVLHLGEESGA